MLILCKWIHKKKQTEKSHAKWGDSPQSAWEYTRAVPECCTVQWFMIMNILLRRCSEPKSDHNEPYRFNRQIVLEKVPKFSITIYQVSNHSVIGQSTGLNNNRRHTCNYPFIVHGWLIQVFIFVVVCAWSAIADTTTTSALIYKRYVILIHTASLESHQELSYRGACTHRLVQSNLCTPLHIQMLRIRLLSFNLMAAIVIDWDCKDKYDGGRQNDYDVIIFDDFFHAHNHYSQSKAIHSYRNLIRFL